MKKPKIDLIRILKNAPYKKRPILLWNDTFGQLSLKAVSDETITCRTSDGTYIHFDRYGVYKEGSGIPSLTYNDPTKTIPAGSFGYQWEPGHWQHALFDVKDIVVNEVGELGIVHFIVEDLEGIDFLKRDGTIGKSLFYGEWHWATEEQHAEFYKMLEEKGLILDWNHDTDLIRSRDSVPAIDPGDPSAFSF